MKIDRRKPGHWLLLLLAGTHALAAAVLRVFVRRRRRLVLLYGHKLGGNLLALHREMDRRGDIEVAFLTMDPVYHRQLIGEGRRSVLAVSPRCIPSLVSAAALVTDHGLHALLPLLRLSDLKFFDVWHAIPFKGFDADDFRVQHRYEETWVASPLLARIYATQYAFPAEKIVVTGYARTDRLVREKDAPRASLRERLGLPADGKVVLFAPTWKQDSDERSLFPFGIEPDAFCAALSSLAHRTGATVVLRTHLNSGPGVVDVSRYERLHSLPYADCPDTEEVLLATDVLVCDWSSIAFDFLLLGRPAIFLDVPSPFRKGFTLGPEYRYGELVGDLPSLLSAIEAGIVAPDDHAARFRAHARAIRQDIYGGFDDGNSAARCVARLQRVPGMAERRD